MPSSLATTFLAASAITLAAGSVVACAVFLGLAVALEILLFFETGRSDDDGLGA